MLLIEFFYFWITAGFILVLLIILLLALLGDFKKPKHGWQDTRPSIGLVATMSFILCLTPPLTAYLIWYILKEEKKK